MCSRETILGMSRLWSGAGQPVKGRNDPSTRVATFEFDDAALEALLDRIRSTGMPEDVPAKRVTVLADRDAGKVVVAIRFDSEEDLRKGSATLDAMSPPEVGTRRRVYGRGIRGHARARRVVVCEHPGLDYRPAATRLCARRPEA